ncbi:hypothetical protein [Streptomyces sp. NPDC007100]|uniref:hypothetical protein n=1 Tax=Streptomyces sp. NPDC007100 TaxID=3155602 RepID=UPI003409E38D
MTAPRAHVGRLEDGTEVKLGVSLSNTKSRRVKLIGWATGAAERCHSHTPKPVLTSHSGCMRHRTGD